MVAGISVFILIIVNIVLGLRAFTFASDLKTEISAKSSSLIILYAIQNEMLTSADRSLLPLKSKKSRQYYSRAKASLRGNVFGVYSLFFISNAVDLEIAKIKSTANSPKVNLVTKGE